jgi:hypothetical protein
MTVTILDDALADMESIPGSMQERVLEVVESGPLAGSQRH